MKSIVLDFNCHPLCNKEKYVIIRTKYDTIDIKSNCQLVFLVIVKESFLFHVFFRNLFFSSVIILFAFFVLSNKLTCRDRTIDTFNLINGVFLIKSIETF